MFDEFDEFDKQKWYKEHKKKMLEKSKYHNPCENCLGEDCVCCSYGRGY